MAVYWYDGEFVSSDSLTLNINEPGLLFGATVFTTLRVYEQSLTHPLTAWQAHCDRLQHSVQTFHWPQPDWPRLRQGAEQLIPHYPVLRLVIFSDGREWIIGRSLPPNLAQKQQQGIMAWVAEDELFQRTLAHYKTGNYLGAWLALQQAQTADAQEAILIDPQGHWLETSTGNLWGWHEDGWYTPPIAAGILPGIARSHLLNSLQQQGIPVHEIPWSTALIAQFDAIGYSNCVVQVIPFQDIIHQAEQRSLQANHPCFEQLRTSWASSAPTTMM